MGAAGSSSVSPAYGGQNMERTDASVASVAAESAPAHGRIEQARASLSAVVTGEKPPGSGSQLSLGTVAGDTSGVGPSRSLFGSGTQTWLAIPASGTRRAILVPTDSVIIKTSWRDVRRCRESAIYARIRRGVDSDNGDANSVQRTWAAKLNEYLKDERFSPRIVIESVGIPLCRFRSTRELVEATRDAMKGELGH
ncbi:hypothetical protein OE88DRAFT_1293345 [Heliocybe sulcata]|uniref:Uncharacterized protein n=1 Tax=Heliocybe sulcata TaxID=5364 RepID=A0A5C3N4X7_9AGAM|nr:hypothetical protein OE88DRAFT_1293345 [Heliocybe sulcata]